MAPGTLVPGVPGAVIVSLVTIATTFPVSVSVPISASFVIAIPITPTFTILVASAVIVPLSVAAAAFRVRGRYVGILALYASEPNFFSHDECQLVREVAADISFALGNFAKAEMDDLAHMLGAVSAEAKWLADGDDVRFMNDVALRLQD